MDVLAFLRRLATIVAVLLALDAFLQSTIPLVLTSSVVVPAFGVVGQAASQSSLWLLAASLLAVVVVTSPSPALARRWGRVTTTAAGVALLLAGLALLTGRQDTGAIPAPASRLLVQSVVSAGVLAAGLWLVGRMMVRGSAHAEG